MLAATRQVEGLGEERTGHVATLCLYHCTYKSCAYKAETLCAAPEGAHGRKDGDRP